MQSDKFCRYLQIVEIQKGLSLEELQAQMKLSTNSRNSKRSQPEWRTTNDHRSTNSRNSKRSQPLFCKNECNGIYKQQKFKKVLALEEVTSVSANLQIVEIQKGLSQDIDTLKELKSTNSRNSKRSQPLLLCKGTTNT